MAPHLLRYLAKHLLIRNNFLTNRYKLHVYTRHNYCGVSHVVKVMCTHIRMYAIGIMITENKISHCFTKDIQSKVIAYFQVEGHPLIVNISSSAWPAATYVIT